MSDTKVEPESGKESRRKCRTHGRMHALVQDVSVWIHGHRLAVALSCTFAGLNIAMWIGFALAGRPLPLRSLRTSLQEFNLLHLLATLLLTRGILQLLVDTIALLVMFSIAETLLGRRRTLTAPSSARSPERPWDCCCAEASPNCCRALRWWAASVSRSAR